MKVQTSIEFIMIMAAVAGLSATFVYIYSHVGAQVNAVYGYLNKTQQNNESAIRSSADAHMYAYAYVPPVLYMGNSGSIEVLAEAPPNASNMSIVLKSRNFEFSPKYASVNTSISPYIAYFEAIPIYAGNASIEVIARAVESNGTVAYDSINESAYVYPPSIGSANESNSADVTATLSGSNESVLYALSSGGSIPKLKETSHCTYLNFWYTPLSFQAQCGNAAWDFSIFSDSCYDAGSTGTTYCIYEDPTGASVDSITGQGGFMYNLTISLTYGNKTYTAVLDSNITVAPLRLGSLIEGNVTIGGQIDGQAAQGPASLYVMDYNMENYTISAGTYDTYSQYNSALDAKLGYYNGSSVGPAEFSSIQQSIGSYDAYLRKFLNTSSTGECKVIEYSGKNYLSCPPSTQLDFTNITVYMDNYTAEKTIYADGSTINLR